jgi:predicted acetyltransferase
MTGITVPLRRTVSRARSWARLQVRGRTRRHGRAPVDAVRPSPAGGSVRLVPVRPEQRGVLANLMQLYRHDLSEFRGYELTEEGTYRYEYLDRYLDEDGREALFIRVDGKLAGFVLNRLRDDGAWQISELFVARPYRRHGVGRDATRLTFDLHPGRWTCFIDEENGTSMRMCADVGRERATRYYEEPGAVNANGFEGTTLHVSIPGPPVAACCGVAEEPSSGPV